MGQFDDAWKSSVQKVLDRRKKKKQYIVCATCRGNGYVVTDRLSKIHLRTKTCEDCGGSGHSGVKVADSQEKTS